MSNELKVIGTAGQIHYAVLINSKDEIFNTATGLCETSASGDWDHYAVAIPQAINGVYLADMPACPADDYTVIVYTQAGGSPATSDTYLTSYVLTWYNEDIPATPTTVSITTQTGLCLPPIYDFSTFGAGSTINDSPLNDQTDTPTYDYLQYQQATPAYQDFPYLTWTQPGSEVLSWEIIRNDQQTFRTTTTDFTDLTALLGYSYTYSIVAHGLNGKTSVGSVPVSITLA